MAEFTAILYIGRLLVAMTLESSVKDNHRHLGRGIDIDLTAKEKETEKQRVDLKDRVRPMDRPTNS